MTFTLTMTDHVTL